MPTDKQLAANRANARKSTGPKTPDGKARSSQNARKHGLRAARFCLLPSEDPDEFEQFVAAYHDEYLPQTPTEDRYFTQMVTAAWKLDRLSRLEAGLFEDSCASLPRIHPNNPAYAPGQTSDSPGYGRLLHKALHCIGNAQYWDRYLRHQQSLERSFARAEAALLRLRKQEPLPEPPPQDTPPPPQNEPNSPAPPSVPTAVKTLFLLFAMLLLTPKTAQTNPIAATLLHRPGSTQVQHRPSAKIALPVCVFVKPF